VSWDEGVIHNVKIIGHESENNREYTKDALLEAVSLYEGRNVNSNHPSRPKDERKNEECIGWLEGVHYRDDGLYGNLHLFTTHPFSRTLMEAAEKKPDAFSLSHNADGAYEVMDNRKERVHHILELRSVDVVMSGATTKSLFESKQPVVEPNKMKVRKIFESLGKDRRVPKWRQKILLEMTAHPMYEEDDEYGDEEMPVDDEMGLMDDPALDAEVDDVPMMEDENDLTSDPDAALADGFRAAVIGCLDDDGIDLQSKIAKIKELLTAKEKLLSVSEEAADEVDAVVEDDDDDVEIDVDVDAGDDDEPVDFEEDESAEFDEPFPMDEDFDAEDVPAVDAEDVPAVDAEDVEDVEDEDEEMLESKGRKRTLKQHKKKKRKSLTESRVKELCDLGGIDATKELIESCVDLTQDKAIRLIKFFKESKEKTSGRPRSSGGVSVGKNNGSDWKRADFVESINGAN